MLEREYESPPQEVFNAWIDPTVLRLWFGCAEDRLWNVHAWEARVGGSIHVSLDFGGGPFVVKGEFLVVDPPGHLKYRWADDEIVEVTIESRGSGSFLRLSHTFPVHKSIRPFLTAGWSCSLEQLSRV